MSCYFHSVPFPAIVPHAYPCKLWWVVHFSSKVTKSSLIVKNSKDKNVSQQASKMFLLLSSNVHIPLPGCVREHIEQAEGIRGLHSLMNLLSFPVNFETIWKCAVLSAFHVYSPSSHTFYLGHLIIKTCFSKGSLSEMTLFVGTI